MKFARKWPNEGAHVTISVNAMIRTFADAGVLIAAARGEEPLARRALGILEDTRREFITSPFSELEVLPKAVYRGRQTEAKFYREYFATRATHSPDDLEGVVRDALILAREVGLAAMDALHIAAAAALNCDEFITTEKPNSPIYRNRSVHVVFFLNAITETNKETRG